MDQPGPLDLVGPRPTALPAIRAATAEIGFAMACEDATGGLLRVLAGAKPGGTLLELGTGTGVGTAWLLDGMDAEARLVTVDDDPRVSAVARRFLANDPRATFVVEDGTAFLRAALARPTRFDLVFADAFPGKFEALDEALAVLAPGGLYVIDDLLPQPTWPEGHQARVDALLATLAARPDLHLARLAWSSGVAIGTRRAVWPTGESDVL